MEQKQSQIHSQSRRRLTPFEFMAKWLTLGCLGTVSLFILLIFVLYMLFTPLLEIDSQTNEVRLFGGAFKFQPGESFSYQWNSQGDKENEDEHQRPYSFDKEWLLTQKPKSLVIQSEHGGQVALKNSSHDQLIFNCQVGRESLLDPYKSSPEGQQVIIDISSYGDAECEILIPEGVDLRLQWKKGKTSIHKFKNNYHLVLDQGTVYIEDHGEHSYEPRIEGGALSAFPYNENPKYKAIIEGSNLTVEF